MLYKVWLMPALLTPTVLGGLTLPPPIDGLVPGSGTNTAASGPSTTNSTNDDLVRTPIGLVPKKNTHYVPEGARLRHNNTNVDIVWSNGTIINSVSTSGKSQNSSQNIGRFSPRDIDEGHVVFAYCKANNSNPFANFSTFFDVPQPPRSTDGQLLYIYDALVSNEFDVMLQSVLQYGLSAAGGGNFWTVSSWYLVNADLFHTNATVVSSGQTLHSTMILGNTATSTDGVATYPYTSSFTGFPNSAMVVSLNKELGYAYQAFGDDNISGPFDLPSGQTTMRNISFFTQDGKDIDVAWIADNSDAATLANITVVKNGTNGEVDILYPTQQTNLSNSVV